MEPMETQSKPKSSRVVIYVIIAILILLGLWWILAKDGGIGGGGEEVTEIGPGETLRRVGEGNIISGFPEELILEEEVEASDSYSIEYQDQNVSQPVVTFTSNWTLEQNIEEYGNYLSENDWEISHEASADEDVTFFYASKGVQDVNITFNDSQDTGVVVTIAVATKGDIGADAEETTPLSDEAEETTEE